MKTRKWPQRIGFALAALATLLVLALAFENYRGKRAWQRCRKELEAQGEVLEMAKLIPPPVPDDQNFARTPLLRPLGDFERGPRGQITWRDTNANGRVQALFDWSGRGRSKGTWRDAAFTDLREAQQSLREEVNSGSSVVRAWVQTPPAEPAADLLALLRGNQAELDELHAALRRPASRFNINYEDSVGALLPHLSVLRNASRAFTLRAQAQLATGHPAAALADVEDSLALADTIQTEPLLISGLVRLAILEQSLQPVWEGLARRQWNQEQLAALQTRLERLNLVADLSRAMRGERVFCLAALDYIRQNPGGGLEETGGLPPFLGYWLTGWVNQNRVTIARLVQDNLLPAYDPTNRVVNLAAARAQWQQAEAELKSVSPYKIFAKLLLPALGKVSERTARAQAAADLAVVACALERCSLARGAYPERLEQLVPDFIQRVPLDPASREPLQYRRSEDGRFVVWSVGANLKDDHGTPEAPRKSAARDAEPQGDWVWRYPAKTP